MANKPLVLRMPERMACMVAASTELFKALRRLSVLQLKALRPTQEYVPLIAALIDVRTLLDAPAVEPRDFEPTPRQRQPW